MSTAVKELGQKLNAVQADKAVLDMERRNAQAYARNQKAQRLVRRLEECDGSIALLLSQAAESLDALITASSSTHNAGPSQRTLEANGDQQLVVFEARAQEWYATLNEVQLGLRSAVKNLRKVQRAPVAFEASSLSRSNNVAVAQMGSAARGHSHGLLLSAGDGLATPTNSHSDPRSLRSRSGSPMDNDENELWRAGSSSSSTHDLGRNPSGSLLGAFVDTGNSSGDAMLIGGKAASMEETKLSLSALRQQERSWKQLSEALSAISASRRNSDDVATTSDEDRLSDRTVSSPSQQRSLEQLRNTRHSQLQRASSQMAADTYLHHTTDSRLMNALLRMHVEVVPETTVSPMAAATASV